MRRSVLALAGSVACRASGSRTLAATCEPTDQPQVFACEVSRSEAGPASLVLTAPGADTRTFRSPVAATEHRFLAWGLLADTAYAWDAGDGVIGRLTTGSLPPELDALEVTVEGGAFGVDGVLVHVRCGYFLILDPLGRVLWFHRDDLWQDLSDGMRWSQAEKNLLVSRDGAFREGPSEVVRVDRTGNELLRLTDAELELNATHDLDTWHGYTYVLGHTGSWGVGGVEVFDGTTRLGRWMLSDDFSDQPGLERIHANSVSVSEAGEAVVSLYDEDAVIAFDGDPASPGFLRTTWIAQGDPAEADPLPDPDYVARSGPLFAALHDARRVGTDELWLFDNRSRVDHSRALRARLDAASGTLVELGSWDLDHLCPFQGGAIPVPGGVLVTCATTGGVNLFRDGSDAPDWRLLASCGGDAGASMTRAYPVTID